MAAEAQSRTDAALAVRSRLVEALELDLVGPWPGHRLEQELLPGWVRPSNWYLTGFLIPRTAPPEQAAQAGADDQLDETLEAEGDEPGADTAPAKPGFFPSSIGLSTLVPADTDALSLTVHWGDYTYEPGEDRTDGEAPGAPDRESPDAEPTTGDGPATGRRPPAWRRVPRASKLTVPLAPDDIGQPHIHEVPESAGLELHVLARSLDVDRFDGELPAGTRSVSLFLVNNRTPDRERADAAFAFQAQLEVASPRPFVPRPDLHAGRSQDWDDRVADLQYADCFEYATGHAVAADWVLDPDGSCRLLRTRWIPSAQVEKTVAGEAPGTELRMRVLGELSDGDAARTALSPLASEYRAWIEHQQAVVAKLPARRRDTAAQLLHSAAVAADRIERGIASLAANPEALDAFRLANRAVASALVRRLEIAEPAWRPFQLAFLLLNLSGLVDPDDPHRQTVDLLYFPTGGGKTEAYLALSAFAMVLRRLRHPADKGLGGAGVSVIMRYTLRLLTLDQLSRAAGLVCALELEREADPDRYGAWPFEIGLWVGKAATPIRMGKKGDGRSDTARSMVNQFKANPQAKPSPIPLEECPWCGSRFEPESFTLLPDSDQPRDLRIVCANFDCEFNGERSLPIVAVDEPLYRRLPAFLIATVDKFAALPWIGESGVLLGGADRADQTGFYGAAEPRRGQPLSAPLPPPDLVIQDELHLISGPLGTMAGLYETAIDALCARSTAQAGEQTGGAGLGPKIVASTATVRRAQDQIQALFARPLTQVFPPPGPDRRDSFFARTVPADTAPARLYVGVAAQGRNPKVAMRRVWLALMAAAERCYRDLGGHTVPDNPADPYMTIVGYFNSLRELGGARRILEEEVRSTLRAYGARRRLGETDALFQDRTILSDVFELTSRESTKRVAEARRRLASTFNQPDRVDYAIATNMISVGLDIPRLGLMGVLGQPKTTSEYIQATSRVGRADWAPGLVVTLLNFHKPRDRSHLERFRHFHETFYRSIEVASVTPFAARAIDRGFAGTLVAAARHLRAPLEPALGAGDIVAARPTLERELLQIFERRLRAQPFDDERERDERLAAVRSRIADLLDSWIRIQHDYQSVGVELRYQRWEGNPQARPLLREVLDTDFESEHHRKFRVHRSLRDVEPSVGLFLRDLGGNWIQEVDP
jgi:hypothetical protein